MGLTDTENQNNRYDGSTKELTNGVNTKGKWRTFSLAISLIIISGISFYETSALDGSLPLLQKHFIIRDSQTALINTFSSLTHTLSLLSLWIFGDFIERKKLLCYSISCWIICCFLSLTAQPSFYWVFVLLRSLSSIFSSIFSVLIPVVLADIFDDRSLGKALMFLTFVQMSTGILSSSFTSWFVTSSLPWFSPLIVAPFFSLPLLPFIVCLMKARKRSNIFKKHSFRDSLKLLSTMSFLLMVIGQSCGMFNMIASSFWTPTFLLSAWNYAPSVFIGLSYPIVITLNSFILLLGSIIGLPLVMWIAYSWNFGTGFLVNHKNKRAFPIVVSIGSLSTVVVYLIVLLSTGRNYFISSIFLFLTGFCSASEGALGQLMLLTIVPRRSRSSAVSLSRLITGIVTIPAAQFVGLLSDIFSVEPVTMENRFISFRNALLSSWIFVLFCALSYTFVIFFYIGDSRRAKEKDEMDKEEEEEEDSLLRSIEARNSRMLRSAIQTPSLFLFSFGQEILLGRNSDDLIIEDE